MSDSKKVYLVSSVQYSDYTIDAVFSNVELAKDFCRYHNGAYANDGTNGVGESQIEEMDLDVSCPKVPAGYSTYRVAMTMDGQHYDTEIGAFSYSEYEQVNSYRPNDLGKRHELHFTRGCSGRLPSWPDKHVAIEDHMEVYVLARSVEHAVKIANERRAFVLANNLFDIAMQRARGDSLARDIMWPADDAQE